MKILISSLESMIWFYILIMSLFKFTSLTILPSFILKIHTIVFFKFSYLFSKSHLNFFFVKKDTNAVNSLGPQHFISFCPLGIQWYFLFLDIFYFYGTVLIFFFIRKVHLKQDVGKLWVSNCWHKHIAEVCPQVFGLILGLKCRTNAS